MAPLSKFKVCVFNVKCYNLPAKDKNGFSDPYIKFNFDNFKSFETQVHKKSLNPSFELKQDFYYETRYIQRLREKAIVIECFDKDKVGRDDFIGGCKLDLHTVATGPIHHELELRDNGKPSGKISLDIEFVIVNDILLTIKDVQANYQLDIKSPYIKYHLLNTKTSDYKTKICDNGQSPSWTDFQQVTFNCPLKEFVMESLVLIIKDGKKDRDLCIAQVPLLPFYDFQNKLHPFTTVLKHSDTQVQVGTIEGFIFMGDLPDLAQMVKGTHTDTGITNGEKLMENLESPDLYTSSKPTSPVPTASQQPPRHQLVSPQPSTTSLYTPPLASQQSQPTLSPTTLPHQPQTQMPVYGTLQHQQSPSYQQSPQQQYPTQQHPSQQQQQYPPQQQQQYPAHQYPAQQHQQMPHHQQMPQHQQDYSPQQYPPQMPQQAQYQTQQLMPQQMPQPYQQYQQLSSPSVSPQHYSPHSSPNVSPNATPHQIPTNQYYQQPMYNTMPIPSHPTMQHSPQSNYVVNSGMVPQYQLPQQRPTGMSHTPPPYQQQFTAPSGFVPPFPRPTK